MKQLATKRSSSHRGCNYGNKERQHKKQSINASQLFCGWSFASKLATLWMSFTADAADLSPEVTASSDRLKTTQRRHLSKKALQTILFREADHDKSKHGGNRTL
jgi:hypothetical protein